jgi:hypothetical protein
MRAIGSFFVKVSRKKWCQSEEKNSGKGNDQRERER